MFIITQTVHHHNNLHGFTASSTELEKREVLFLSDFCQQKQRNGD
jgi:hypothetical protein